MCFAHFRRRWDSKGSVINAFAAFLLLSYSKLLTVSYSLLAVRFERDSKFSNANSNHSNQIRSI